jgi:hypothetical protein
MVRILSLLIRDEGATRHALAAELAELRDEEHGGLQPRITSG